MGSNAKMQLPFPEFTYLFDKSRNLIYIPIPKVACSSLKTWFLMSSPSLDMRPDPLTWKVDAWLGNEGNRYLLKDLAPLDNRSNFCFAFVRNPWSRLVSCYINRILGHRASEPTEEYLRVMRKLSRGPWYRVDKRARHHARKRFRGRGWPDRLEITFRQFAERVVAATPPSDMDPHWRPQSAFLGSHDLDFLGRFEHLSQDIGRLSQELGISCTLYELNRSRYLGRESGRCFADCPQADLREMKAMPGYRQFYTRDLVETVANVYARDHDLFGYDF